MTLLDLTILDSMLLVLVYLQEEPEALRDATAGVNFEANNVRRCLMLTTP